MFQIFIPKYQVVINITEVTISFVIYNYSENKINPENSVKPDFSPEILFGRKGINNFASEGSRKRD
jgi:hypothetical protein